MKEDLSFADIPVPLYVEGSSTPIIAIDLPVVYEDEGQEELGEWMPHTTAEFILHCGIAAHLEAEPRYEVFADLDLLYHPIKRRAYVSPDVMVVQPEHSLSKNFDSYRIGEHGPAPLLAIEILSHRSAQQGDLTLKPEIYAKLGVPEFILVDATGQFLEQRLLLRKLQSDATWTDSRDPDGGITSALGFRIVIEDDGQVRVINAATGHRYARPNEAESIAKANRVNEQLLCEAKKLQHEAEEALSKAREERREADEALSKAKKERREAEEALRLVLARNREIQGKIARLKQAATEQTE